MDAGAIGVVGSSHGAHLAAVLAAHRPVRRLAPRVPASYPAPYPAPYKDEDWDVPKARPGGGELDAHRRGRVPAESDRAPRACAAFGGDALVARSERDATLPPPVIAEHRAAFEAVRSPTYRVVAGAGHGLSEARWQRAYTSPLVNRMREMVLGARENGAVPRAHTARRPRRAAGAKRRRSGGGPEATPPG